MSCPICGSASRDLIAPGFYRCRGVISVPRPDPNRGGATVLSQEPCGAAYQEADASTTAEMCACGTFAIGRCGECSRSVCGSHSKLVEGKRICNDDIAKRARSAKADEEKAWQARRAKFQLEVENARQQIAGFLAEMASRGNPGSMRIWDDDPFSMSYSKLLTRASWRGWHLREVNFGNCGNLSIGLTTDGKWLKLKAGPLGRKLGEVLKDDGGSIYWGKDHGFSLLEGVDFIRPLADQCGLTWSTKVV